MKLMEEKDEIIISPKVIWDVLRRNLIFIIVATMVFAIGAFVYTKVFVTKRYTSKMSLYVETNYEINESDKDSQKVVQSMNETSFARRMVATCVKLLDTNTFYTELSEQLDNDYTPGQLKSMISYVVDDEKTIEIFDVQVTSNSPNESKRVADEFAKVAPGRISDITKNITLKLADPGQVPVNPSYPHTTKNVILAAGIALLLSLIIAFVRHFADKKIKYSEEMTEIYDIPVLAAIPNFDSYVQKAGDTQKKTKREE